LMPVIERMSGAGSFKEGSLPSGPTAAGGGSEDPRAGRTLA
jgi:hypothetical protein